MPRKIHLIKRNSFPAHSFFDHLLRGTEHYHHKKFELAAEEWGAAEWLNYDTPIHLRRQDGRIFCGGFIREVPFLFFLYAVYTSKANGIGAIKTNGISKNLVFNEGRLIRAATTLREERIGNLIVKKESLSPATLNRLLIDARKQGKRIGQFLVEKGVLSHDALQELLLLQNEQILIDILHWQHGYFYFLERPIVRDFIVNYNPLNLARAATYKGFSLSQFRNRIPNMKTIFGPAPYAELKSEEVLQKLTDRQQFIFSLIDGTRNIEQIARFSGITESSAVEILYQLTAAGMIRQSLEIIEYEDRQFNEISNLLDTLLEIYAFMSQMLILELGTKAKDVLHQSKMVLSKNYDGLFVDIPWENPNQVTREMVLRNIAQCCPHPRHRGLFIEAFCDLFDQLRLEIERYLGPQLAKEATLNIKNEMKNVLRYAKETPLRSHLMESFAKLAN
ncbi:hypothetical protein D1BOALGB6SA_8080 [Olavius sp. associated proteobacterium Delta 1]|nr:hypothetical protein D1BOALGB6SA_8080 [Olavius sp. associated proteobacterium Delta 1]